MIVASHLRALQIVGSIFSPKARSRGHAAEVDLAPTAPGSLQDYAEFPSAYLGSLMVFFLRGLAGELSLTGYDDRFFPCSLFPRGVRFWYLLRTFPRAPRSWGRRKKNTAGGISHQQWTWVRETLSPRRRKASTLIRTLES